MRELSRLDAWKKDMGLENASSVGLHLRLGDSNMNAGRGRESKDDDVLLIMERCAYEVHTKFSGKTFLVVTSDSERVRQKVGRWNWTAVYKTTAKPFHVDKTTFSTKTKGMEGMISAFVDVMILSLQDFLLLSGTSGFGYLAESIGRYDDYHAVRCMG